MLNSSIYSRGLLAAALVMAMSATTIGLTGCMGDPSAQVPVVTINKTIKITKGEYDKAYKELSSRLMMPKQEKEEALKNKVVQEQLKQSVLNKLIFAALLKADATQMSLAVSDEDVSKFKAENLKNIGGRENFEALLKKEGLSEAEFDKNLKEELLADKFIAAKAGKSIVVPDQEAEAFYKAHQDQFQVPERIKVAHILMKAIDKEIKETLMKDNPKISAEEVTKRIQTIHGEKKAQAEKLLAEIKAQPQQFDKLARERSEDRASATFGGDLNYMLKNQTDPVFWNAAVATKPGSLNPAVVQTQFGYHIIRLDAYEKPHTLTLAEAKPKITLMLQQQLKQQALFQWVNEKRATAKIDFAEGFAPETPQMPGGSAGPEATASSGAKAPAPAAKKS